MKDKDIIAQTREFFKWLDPKFARQMVEKGEINPGPNKVLRSFRFGSPIVRSSDGIEYEMLVEVRAFDNPLTVKKDEVETATDVCRNLSETLRKEDGGGLGFVCIWREGDKGDHARECTVEEWLYTEETRSGEWLIDGGWGGPLGPIMVYWENGEWHSAGFPPYNRQRKNA